MRWLGWLLAGLLVVGIGALIWYAVSDETAEVAAPALLTEIDLRANPELKGVVPGLLMTPEIASIDPRVSPETMRVPVAPELQFVDLYENPELKGFTGAVTVEPFEVTPMDPNSNPHTAVPGNVDPNNNPHSE